jgi:hypothetical protein
MKLQTSQLQECISVNGIGYIMNLAKSDLDGYYKYDLSLVNTRTVVETIYIMPDRQGYFFNGKELSCRNVWYFKTLKNR